jgi:hypothetical protein
LGTASTQASSAFDAAGSATVAQAAAIAASDPVGSAATALASAETFATNALAAALAGLAPAEFPAATQGSSLVHSGTGQTVGGVVVTAGMRVLDTVTGVSSGLWLAAPGAWTRPTDFATGSNAQGKLVDVAGGGLWLCISNTVVTVDTTSQIWQQLDASVIQAGAGLTKTGTVLSLALTKAIVVATGLAPSDIGAAPLNSPGLTGSPTTPTATPLTSTTQIASTAYADLAVAVEKARALAIEALLAPLVSPAFTGTPTAPTRSLGDNSTKLATTAYADNAMASPAAESIIRANSLDQMAPPVASINMNRQLFINQANPGTVLAETFYEPGGGNNYTTNSATFAAVDTTNLTTPSFVAPTTAVIVELQAIVGFFAIGTPPSSVGYCLFLHGTTTQVGYHVTAITINSVAIAGAVPVRIRVTGLTIGVTYQFDWAWAVNTGTGLMPVKATVGGTYTNADTGPAIMRVFVA